MLYIRHRSFHSQWHVPRLPWLNPNLCCCSLYVPNATCRSVDFGPTLRDCWFSASTEENDEVELRNKSNAYRADSSFDVHDVDDVGVANNAVQSHDAVSLLAVLQQLGVLGGRLSHICPASWQDNPQRPLHMVSTPSLRSTLSLCASEMVIVAEQPRGGRVLGHMCVWNLDP